MQSLKVHSDFVTSLPGDRSRQNIPRQVNEACYSFVNPTPVSSPKMLAWSQDLADEFDLSGCQDRVKVEVLSGNKVLPGMQPYAARYGGHQFGHWAGQLGDGRAITLGEIFDRHGKSWELQLKGAGPTPYSRFADGRAVLRSSLREFLCSEAMHHLGIPTTRALSLVKTGDQVLRDMFYDGHPMHEPGAITSRLAPTFLRFGNYQILADAGEYDLLSKLVDYTISRHFPEFGAPDKLTRKQWILEVSQRTAHLIAAWQSVGFVHGVMNTDNMSILGLTIDYGPYGWLEVFDPLWTPNTTDFAGRRYCYGRQPQIGQWNLMQLVRALVHLFPEQERARLLDDAQEVYVSTYAGSFRRRMAAKLGLTSLRDALDVNLLNDFFDMLTKCETDMTIMFRNLADVDVTIVPGQFDWDQLSPVFPAFYDLNQISPSLRHEFIDWFRRYLRRCQQESLSIEERVSIMNAANPSFVLRNYLAQEAIDELTNGSDRRLKELMEALQKPYGDFVDSAHLIAKRPEWARHRPGCSALSCSS